MVVDAKGIVVAGNGTLLASQTLGWTQIDAVRSKLVGRADGTNQAAAAMKCAGLRLMQLVI